MTPWKGADDDLAMIAIDTNVLVYAHGREFAEHRAARQLLESITEGTEHWALPVFCVGEFLRVVTHPTFFQKPSPLPTALAAIRVLLDSPSIQVLLPGERFLDVMLETIAEARVTGNVVFDAQIVALCRENGISTICSNDRDLTKFPGIRVRPI